MTEETLIKKRGRPRRLKPDTDADQSVVEQNEGPELTSIVTDVAVKTAEGQQTYTPMKAEGYNFEQLNYLKPWREDEPLPNAVKVNKGKKVILKKKGEPRYFFRGNLLIKTYKGMAVKTELFKRFKPEKHDLHRRIMKYLKEKVGIQERFR